MKQRGKLLSLLMAGILVTGILSGCGATEKPADQATETGKEKVTITYPTYRVGSHASAAAEKAIIDEFNKLYGDEINLVVEELPSDQAYVDKMKVLAASNELPDVVEGKNGIVDLAIKNGQAVDLMTYLNEDQSYKEEIGEEAIKFNTRDGKLYSIPDTRQLIGYFYNKEIFDQVGITPAKTWEEFLSHCEKIKKAGYAPLALMTGENAWTSNLLLASIIGTDGESGNSFMNTNKPTDYNNASVIKGLEMMQKMLQEYTTQDAVGAIYANAANNFNQGKAAMIANGPWMTADFKNEEKALKGFESKVGVALYPGEGIVSQFEVGYMVCSKDEAKRDAAIKFLKFKTGKKAQEIMLTKNGSLPLTENIEMSDAFKTENPLIVDLINISADAKYKYMNIDNTAYQAVVDVFAKLYPELVFGNITPEEMATKMTEAAAKNK